MRCGAPTATWCGAAWWTVPCARRCSNAPVTARGPTTIPRSPCGAALLADLLHAEVEAASSQLVVTLPGAAGTSWGSADRRDEPTAILRVALTPATVATGCPWVLPGSHRGVEPLGLPVDGAAPVPLDVGDALLVDGALVHRVTDNHSADATAALVVAFRIVGG